MRKLLNVLYVTTPSSYLTRDGQNLVSRVDEEEAFRIPIHNLEGVVTFGYAGASPGAMQLCVESGVSLTFLKESGQFLARVQGRKTGNVLLRRKQYKMADDGAGVDVARRMIFGKIGNGRAVLHRALRDHPDELDQVFVSGQVSLMKRDLGRALDATGFAELRGIEGESARRYFSAFDQLVLVGKDSFSMKGRSRRPPQDRINALLSFVYSLLRNEVQSALETVGLDPFVGFLHRDRPGRPSLALDLMEELRPYLADRLVLSLINRRQIAPNDFVFKESGAVLMKDQARKEVITSWQKRKREEIMHSVVSEKIPLGLLPYVQALLLARHVRGDLPAYPPFLWK